MLWIATWGGGLDRFDPRRQTFTHHREDPSNPERLQDDRVQSLFEDRDGTLWVGTFEGGLAQFDRQSGSFRTFRHDPGKTSSLSHDRVWDIVQDHDGRLWIGTEEGLCQFDPTSETFEAFFHDPASATSLSSSLVRVVEIDRSNTLWVGTNHGLNRFDRTSKTFERYYGGSSSLSHDLVDAIWEDHTGYLWIGTGGGLNRFDSKTGTFEQILADPRDPHSLNDGHVSSIVEDRSDNLWVGTRSGGVDKLDLKPVKFRYVQHRFDDPESLSAGWVFGFAQDAGGRLWVATRTGLDRYDEESGRFVHFRHNPNDPRSLPDNQVRDVVMDHHGLLWVSTWRKGLSQYVSDEEGFLHFRHDPNDSASPVSDVVESLYADRSGSFWIATRAGLDRFDQETARFEHFRHHPDDEQSLSDNYVQSLYEDLEGFLWVGTNRGGLNRFDRERKVFERFQSDPSDPTTLSNDRVHAICNDKHENLWVGTSNGLNKLRPNGTFRRYFGKDGLPNNRISGLLCGRDDYVWLSTFGGLARFDIESEIFRKYTADDGVPSQPFIRGSYFESLQGHMYFGGENGFNVFDPTQIVDNPHIPPVVLTSISIFDQPTILDVAISELSEMELSWQENVLTFEFAALDYTSPGANRYRFKLEGLDSRWSSESARREARYTGLDPGHYVFRVQGSNNDGAWNEEGASIEVIISPPPWQTWWAYVSYVFAAMAVVLSFMRSQRRKIERERSISRRLLDLDKLKDEFLANTSHELRTPLYGITGIAESLIDGERGELPPTVASDLGIIVASGRRLGALVSDILDFSELKHHSLVLDRRPVDLRASTEVVLGLSRPLLGTKDLELVNAIAPELPPADADENRLHQILHNLISNAIKFTDSGTIEVSAAVEGTRLVVRVLDTGSGISKESQERIFEAFERGDTVSSPLESPQGDTVSSPLESPQGDTAMDREIRGTGLGLAVTRHLVELHDGRIWVDSSPGEGSRFFFTLPISKRERDEPAPAPPIRIPTTDAVEELPPLHEAVPGRATILVVDDEPVNRRVLRSHLSMQNLEVTVAASGAEALRRLKEQRFDLVLLDIMMPKMSGFAVCRVLRETYPMEQLPVIFLTAKQHTKDVVTGLSLGANDYLTKPISKEELIARIRPHLDLTQINRKLEKLVEEKISQIKILRGLLPICASCKKIRDDEGYWSELEVFIGSHSEAHFSHGICPDCLGQYYDQLRDDSDFLR